MHDGVLWEKRSDAHGTPWSRAASGNELVDEALHGQGAGAVAHVSAPANGPGLPRVHPAFEVKGKSGIHAAALVSIFPYC